MSATPPTELLEQIRALHDEWGETNVENIDVLDLWERLDRILNEAP